MLATSPRRCGLLAVLIVVAIAALAPAAVAHGGAGTAPGAPGAEAWWTPADKDGFGTAASLDSKLWHTLEQGELTEVYYPDLGTPSIRDMQLVVTDGRTFADRERDDTTHKVQLVDPRSLIYRQIDTAKSGA
jgi:glucoamylase